MNEDVRPFGELLSALVKLSAPSDRVGRFLLRVDVHELWTYVHLHPEKLRAA